jgi:hypothetical protein
LSQIMTVQAMIEVCGQFPLAARFEMLALCGNLRCWYCR